MPARHASFAADETPPEEAGAAPLAQRWSVLLPLPLAGAYDYLAPDGTAPEPGSFVAVPLGRRTVAGVVWGPAGADGVAADRLKPIAELLDAPPLPDELRRLVDWVSGYTMTPPGAVLRMAMSVSDALAPPRPVMACVLTEAGRAALRDQVGTEDETSPPSQAQEASSAPRPGENSNVAPASSRHAGEDAGATEFIFSGG